MPDVNGVSWMAAAFLLAVSPAARPAERAIWIWEQPSYAMVESPTEADAAFAFLRRQRVGTLYLYADSFQGRNLIVERPQAYRDFISRAHRKGFKVYALLGSAYLNTERYVLPARRADARAMLQRVLAYNAAAGPGGKFDGVNFDIEPHLLDQWSTEKRKLLHDFLEMSASLMALKRKSGETLPIGPAMPFWWDGIELAWHGKTKPVSQHVIDTVDYVVLMDYRNKAAGGDGILAHADSEMAYATQVHKPVVIGLEITPNELDKVTFNKRTEAEFEQEVALVERAYRGRRAYGGLALHHYRGYQQWLGAQRGN